MELRLKFREVIKLRRISNQSYEKEILNLLLENYDETIKFLIGATNVEIACAIDGLIELVKKLNKVQALKIIEIFKQKREQFPSIQNFTSNDFDKQIKQAELCIN